MKISVFDLWESAATMTGRVQAALDAARPGDKVYLPGLARQGDSGAYLYQAPANGWKINKSIEVCGDGPGHPGTNDGTVVVPGGSGSPYDVFVIEPSGEALEYAFLHDFKITQRVTQDGAHGLRATTLNYPIRHLRFERITVLNMGVMAIALEALDLSDAPIERLVMFNCSGSLSDDLGARFDNIRLAVVARCGVFSNTSGGWLVEHSAVYFYQCTFENNGLSTGASQGQLLLRVARSAAVDACHFEDFQLGKKEGLAIEGITTPAEADGPVVVGASAFSNPSDTGEDAASIRTAASLRGPVAVLPNRSVRVGKLLAAGTQMAGLTVLAQFSDPRGIGPTFPPVVETIELPQPPNGGMVASPSINRPIGIPQGFAGLILPSLSVDPSGAEDGMLFYNSDDNRFRVRIAGAWKTVKTT